MSFHPNPISMAVHVEHHRQELLEQARQERLAREASAGARVRRARPEVSVMVASRLQGMLNRWRPTLAEPVELPQTTPGEAI